MVTVKLLEWVKSRALFGWKLTAKDPFGNEFARLDAVDFHTTAEIDRFKATKQAEYERLILSTIVITVSESEVKGLPNNCDGKEQLAFEEWAKARHYDMHEHPLHYLFLDAKTNAARKGWSAAITYCRAQVFVANPPTDRLKAYIPDGKAWFHTETLEEMQAFYLSRLPAIRAAARELGYAIGLHGSTRRDFDLMAMPWREFAADKEDLARAIALAACGITSSKYSWTTKPAGCFSTSIPICWQERDGRVDGEGILDLSVMPSTEARARVTRKEGEK